MTQPITPRSVPWFTLILSSLLILSVPWIYVFEPTPITPAQQKWLGEAAYGPLFVQGDWDHPAWQKSEAMTQPPLGKYAVALSLASVGREIPTLDAAETTAYPSETLAAARRPSAAGAVLALICLFLIGRQIQGFVLGALVMILVAVHPAFRSLAGTIGPEALALGLVCWNLLLNLALWRELDGRDGHGRRWLLLSIGLVLSMGLAWATEKAAGIQTTLATCLTLLVAAWWQSRHRVHVTGRQPVARALALAVLAPLGGAALAWGLDPALAATDTGVQALLPALAWPNWEAAGDFWLDGLADAFWLPAWITALLLLWSWWRTVRRGRRRSQHGHVPYPWGVSLHTLFALSPSLWAATQLGVSAHLFARYVPWLIFLGAFLGLDLIHGLVEQLQLEPPEGGIPARRTRVLIVCTGNSCRSQMAEALWRHEAGHQYEIASAGTEPKPIHPLTLRVLNEIGVPTNQLRSKHIKDLDLRSFQRIITVCDHANTSCPVVPGMATREHWPFEDPAAATGTEEEKLAVFRRVRDAIRARIRQQLKK